MVEQRDWDQPDRDEWVAALHQAVSDADGSVVLVAHSLGCHTVAHWAAKYAEPVRGALLVAPPDLEYSVDVKGATAIAGFGPPASVSLPFPAVLAASRTDPWAPIDRSRRLAKRWGADFVDLGEAGHVNPASGNGPWVKGEELLEQLLVS